VQTNTQLHRSKGIEDTLSGTTSVSVFFEGDTVYVANVGDSRAIIASRDPVSGRLVGKALSEDQTPYRKDERERCKRSGARVMSMDQIEGLVQIHENWGLNLGEEIDDDGDPPRLWHPDGDYPGSAFTRSIGDSVAESIGCFAEPEILTQKLKSNDEFIVIASDGVFEFITTQACVDMTKEFENPLDACKSIVSEAYRLWLQYEVRTDDITMICIHLSGLAGPAGDHTPKSIGFGAGESRPVRRGISREKRRAIMSASRTTMHMALEEKEYDPSEHITPKTPDEIATIAAAVRANFLFAHLNEEQRQTVFDVMEKVDVVKGQDVIKQGEEGDKFYVVESGSYDVWKSHGRNAPAEKVYTYVSGQGLNPSFGELALMYGKPRAATVRAVSAGRLWALDRRAFRSIVLKSSASQLVRTLRSCPVLKSLSPRNISRLADMLTEVTIKAGQDIIKQGDTGDTFYVVKEGEVVCTVDGNDVLRLGSNQ
jgi:CRP-like cAMP-binding protein/serine/threonine protein phosphatase PrpC